MNALNLSHSELIVRLQGSPRSKVVRACLDLHSKPTVLDIGSFRVTKRRARGMVCLASPRVKEAAVAVPGPL